MVYSFDVFDTLITRSTATPEGIFAVMQRRLGNDSQLDEFIKANFYELRIGAEQVARNTYCKDGIEDVTLEQIYGVFVQTYKISQKQAVFLQNLERQTEVDYVYGIPRNIARVKGLIADRQRVILISDMYLDGDTIRRMLVKVDPVFEGIPLYVSSNEEKKNKYSGNLFRAVKEKEHLEYREWVHTGDNIHSDYNVPKSLGISSERYAADGLLEIEKHYFKNENDAGTQLMLGAAKLARLYGEKSEEYRLGCGIGGPVLYPYVEWLLADSVKRGINRLYFVARDGYLLKEIADELVRQKALTVSTHYIYGSRRAWRIPDSEGLQDEIREIYEGAYKDRIFCLSDMADFFQMGEEELSGFLPLNLCKKQVVWNIPVTTIVLNYLLRRPDFLKRLSQIYERKRKLLINYLRQEIDIHDDKFAFVDLAGTGLTQECLAKVLGQFYEGKVKNYFFRLDQIKEAICDYYVFYPNFVPYYVLLEMLCRAPHEQTVGYEETEDGRIIPVFTEVDGLAIVKHRIPEFIRGARRFAGIYEEVLTKNPGFSGSVSCILPYLNYIYHSPDPTVLDYFGDMPDMLTGREKQVSRYGPKLSDKDIKNLFWYRGDQVPEYGYKGASLPYSLLRCTEKQKRKIERYQWLYGSLYGRVYRYIRKAVSSKLDYRAASVYDCIPNCIAIYGAGKVGQRFYRQITGREKVNGIRYSSDVVLWLDRNYEMYQREGMPVCAPAEAMKQEYAMLVIAVAQKSVADSIEKSLLEIGVERHKIFWLRQ